METIAGILILTTTILLLALTINEIINRVKSRREHGSVIIEISKSDRKVLHDEVVQALQTYVRVDNGAEMDKNVAKILSAGVLIGLKYVYAKEESTRNDGAGEDDEEIEDDGPAANGNMQVLHV